MQPALPCQLKACVSGIPGQAEGGERQAPKAQLSREEARREAEDLVRRAKAKREARAPPLMPASRCTPMLC